MELQGPSNIVLEVFWPQNELNVTYLDAIHRALLLIGFESNL